MILLEICVTLTIYCS